MKELQKLIGREGKAIGIDVKELHRQLKIGGLANEWHYKVCDFIDQRKLHFFREKVYLIPLTTAFCLLETIHAEITSALSSTDGFGLDRDRLEAQFTSVLLIKSFVWSLVNAQVSPTQIINKPSSKDRLMCYGGKLDSWTDYIPLWFVLAYVVCFFLVLAFSPHSRP